MTEYHKYIPSESWLNTPENQALNRELVDLLMEDIEPGDCERLTKCVKCREFYSKTQRVQCPHGEL